jgi:hypothetical protein
VRAEAKAAAALLASQRRDRNLATLSGAAGLLAFFDLGRNLTLRTSGASRYAAAVVDRTGAHTLSQATDALQPLAGQLSPTGRAGCAFDGTNDVLASASDQLIAQIDQSASYSALWVKRSTASAVSRTVWGGLAQTIAHYESSNAGRYVRNDGAQTINNSTAASTAIVVRSCVYSGAAYSDWENGALTCNASANARAPASTRLALGALSAVGTTQPYLGTIWCLIIALGAWSQAQREAYELAAYRHWIAP